MLKHITLLLMLAPVTPATAETGFLARTVEMNANSYRYQVFVPAQWTPDEEWPVIFFLHGAGERGDDGVRQLYKGLPEILREKSYFPAVVVMPQCRRRTWWGDPAMEAQAFAALEAAIRGVQRRPVAALPHRAFLGRIRHLGVRLQVSEEVRGSRARVRRREGASTPSPFPTGTRPSARQPIRTRKRHAASETFPCGRFTATRTEESRWKSRAN